MLQLVLWAGLATLAVAAAQTLYSTFFTFQLFRVVERRTNKEVDEPVPFDDRIRLAFLYRSSIGRLILNSCGGGALLISKSRQLGEKSDSPKSVADIPKFIVNYHVDTSELDEPLSNFKTLNEFFFRKLRAGVRPVHAPSDPSIAVQPADSRVTVFSSIDSAQKLWIKGSNFSVPALLGNEKLAEAFEHGAVAVCRLAPQDYHRFHSPVSGRVGAITLLGTELHTVKSFVINSPFDVFTTNKRVVVTLEDTVFGTVAIVLVGAVYVGSVVITAKQGERLEKGQELGYFAYGGSTAVVLFGPNKITFDSDLLSNSANRVETLVRCSDSLGTLAKAAQ